MTPADIRARMEKIPNEDLIPLGINPDVARPEWTILTVLPVPPVTMRPSIILENGQRSEDDLTHKLVDIIRINQRFKENQDAGAPQLIIEDLWELLQYHVTTYLDNEVAGCPPARHRSGRPLKTLSQRLKGKDGRFRGSLSGKRVNFSSRTVISPDPNLSVSQVGVPRAVANEITIPVRVTIHNIDELRQIVRNGRIRPDVNAPCGANYVLRPDNRRLRLADGNLDTVADMIEPSKIGLIFHAIREDEVTVRASGINTTRYKLLAFCLSRLFAGLAGGLYAHFNKAASPSTLELLLSFQVIIWAVFGGIATIYGPIVSVLILYPFTEYVPIRYLGGLSDSGSPILRFLAELSDARLLVFACLVLVVLLFMPRGMVPWLRDRTEKVCPRCKLQNVACRRTYRVCTAGLD